MGLVSALVALPLLAAIAILLLPSRAAGHSRTVALVASSLHVLLTTVVTAVFVHAEPETGSLRLVEEFVWFAPLGIRYFVGMDGVSLSMVILTSIVVFCGVLASWRLETRPKEFFALLLVLATGVFGVFVSFDLFLFFVFYEVAVLPMYLLIGVWGSGPKEYSAMKLTLMLMVGSALLLVGILALKHLSPAQSFSIIELAREPYPVEAQRWLFPLVFVGFGVLGALFPFHTWSPDGHASAPTAVSMLHAGVLMKLGGYGILRVGIYLLPEGAKEWALFFMALATINIVYGAFAAVLQKDLKYFTAYSSVSHCGFVLFGLSALNFLGMKGAVLQMFSHGVMTALFFALIGMVYQRTHTRLMTEMSGLGAVTPWIAVCFYIGGLASLGLPGLSGFVAESHVFLGGFLEAGTTARILTVVATISIVVTAVYVLRGLGRVFLGEIRDPGHEAIEDASWNEKLATGVLAAALILVGLAPTPLVSLIEAPVAEMAGRLEGSR